MEGRQEQKEGEMDPTVQKPVPNALGTRARLLPAMPGTTRGPQLSPPQGWENRRRLTLLQALSSNWQAETEPRATSCCPG